MPPRLTDLYQPADRVEILFEEGRFSGWYSGQVIGHQHPGIWVQTTDGSLWFVTNGRRIRPLPDTPAQKPE